MKLKIKKRISIIFAVFILAGVFSYIFSRSSCAGGLVPCTDDCNLCYLLVGISNIFLYLTGSLLMAAVLLGIVIGGMVYMISGLFPQALNFAKLAFSVSLKALAIVLCGWLAINSIMNVVGYKHPTGGKWYQFDCSGNANTQTASTSSNTSNTSNTNSTNNNSSKSQCDSKDKKLDSIKIQCAEKTTSTSTTSQTSEDGTGFYVALDTLSEDEKGKTKQLKAIGKYTCDGTTSEEDITAQAEWKASDETQIKVAKGLVQAVAKNMTSESPPYVEAKFQEKNSNQAKVYINSCPNTTASIETTDKFSLQFDNLLIPKAHAEPNSSFCASCGQAKTCFRVAGTESLKPKNIIILMRSDNFSQDELCEYGSKSWGNGDDTWKSFQGTAQKLARGIQFIEDSVARGTIAIYVSSIIGESDSNCPTATHWTSYGYVQNGDGAGANARFGQNAKYCVTTGEAEFWSTGECYDKIFAHEQIGHALAGLEDEYVKLAYNPDEFLFGPGYNCTGDRTCAKWGHIKEACVLGCRYTNYYYRSSENSIMNRHWTASGFGKLNSYIIQQTASYGIPGDIVPGLHLKEHLVIYPPMP